MEPYRSFTGREAIMGLIEEIRARLFGELLGREVSRPFPRLTYAESMARYGVGSAENDYGMDVTVTY